MTGSTDRSDPAVRAQGRLRRARVRDRNARIAAGVAGVIAAIAITIAAGLAGGDGGVVGGVLLTLLALGLAGAVWPYDWPPAEARHHELLAIWRELRTDADQATPWPRYAAWAAPEGVRVKLSRLTWQQREPSPLTLEPVGSFAAEEMVEAAEAMEVLRAECAGLESAARERHEHDRLQAEQRAFEDRLRAVDESARSYEQARAQQLREEDAARERAESAAQAEALARALRRG